jgi:hypothetical protein
MSSILFFFHRFHGNYQQLWGSLSFLFIALGLPDILRALQWRFAIEWNAFFGILAQVVPVARVISNVPTAEQQQQQQPTSSSSSNNTTMDPIIINAEVAATATSSPLLIEQTRLLKLSHDAVTRMHDVIAFLAPGFVILAAIEQDYTLYLLSIFRLLTIPSPLQPIRKFQNWWPKSELTFFTTVVGALTMFLILRPTVLSLDKSITTSFLRTFDWKSRTRNLN